MIKGRNIHLPQILLDRVGLVWMTNFATFVRNLCNHNVSERRWNIFHNSINYSIIPWYHIRLPVPIAPHRIRLPLDSLNQRDEFCSNARAHQFGRVIPLLPSGQCARSDVQFYSCLRYVTYMGGVPLSISLLCHV